MPPRFVPTLTVVIEPEPGTVTDSTAITPQSTSSAIDSTRTIALGPGYSSDTDMLDLEAHLLDRVLQRIDLSLEERLSDAVSAAVQVQLDAMLPVLRAEIEVVLRAVVAESLAAELSEYQGSARFSAP
ncbi:MAG: hypothetical protein V4636_01395 [Pseudomonadota bacterium]